MRSAVLPKAVGCVYVRSSPGSTAAIVKAVRCVTPGETNVTASPASTSTTVSLGIATLEIVERIAPCGSETTSSPEPPAVAARAWNVTVDGAFVHAAQAADPSKATWSLLMPVSMPPDHDDRIAKNLALTRTWSRVEGRNCGRRTPPDRRRNRRQAGPRDRRAGAGGRPARAEPRRRAARRGPRAAHDRHDRDLRVDLGRRGRPLPRRRLLPEAADDLARD